MSEEATSEEQSKELTEEQKFQLKFPGKKPVATDLLRKRMQKGVKFFDSGDYAMAKSEKKGGPVAAINRGKPMPMPLGVGKAIPTPENIPHRKTSVPNYHQRTRSGEYNLVMDH